MTTADLPSASMADSRTSSSARSADSPRFPIGSRAQLGHAAALVAAHAVAVPAGMIAGVVGFGVEDPLRAGFSSLAVLAGVSLLTAGGVVGLGLLRGGSTSLRELGWRSDRPLLDVVRGALCIPLVLAVVTLTASSFFGIEALGEIATTVAGYTPLERLVFALIGVSAAFTEESLFRGYLEPGLIRRWGPTIGIVVGAAIFSVYHLNFSPTSLVSKFLLGVVYGVLRHRTGSLVPGAVAHFSTWAVLGTA